MINFEIKKFDESIYGVNEELIFVVYSHSSFIDILKIQIDYLKDKGKNILLINKNDDDLAEIYSSFNEVIFYDENLTYGNRVLSCITKISHEYFIFIHDNDILIHIDKEAVSRMFNFLKINNFDRVDFQLAYDYDSLHSHEHETNDLYFIKSSNSDTTAKGYPYNVNPSIWKKDTFIDIMTKFGFRDYRTIEHPDTQNYVVNFNIFKLFSNEKYYCGYFTCLKPFVYLHITHSQRFLQLNSLPKESYSDIENEYHKIIEKYNLKTNKRWIN